MAGGLRGRFHRGAGGWSCTFDLVAEHERGRSHLLGRLLAYRSPPPYNLPMATEPLMIERLSALDGQRVLCLRGPLTMENLPSFQNAIRREENAPTVILDLSDVPYMDSAGLGSLVSAYVTRQKATRRIALSGVNERVLKLFETTRVEPLFLIFPTLDDAITGLTTAAEA
jgi:anti-sigma B factor antagonist